MDFKNTSKKLAIKPKESIYVVREVFVSTYFFKNKKSKNSYFVFGINYKFKYFSEGERLLKIAHENNLNFQKLKPKRVEVEFKLMF